MTSPNGNIFCVIVLLWGECIGHRGGRGYIFSKSWPFWPNSTIFSEANDKIWAKFDQCHAKLHRKWLIWWHLRLSRVWFWPIFRSQVYEFGPRSPQPRVWLRKHGPHTPVNFFGVREDVMFSLISHRWIPLIKVQWRGALMFSLMLAKTNCSTNRRVERHDVHFALPSKQLKSINRTLEIVLSMGSANERRRYIIAPSPIGWAHTQNDLWNTNESRS